MSDSNLKFSWSSSPFFERPRTTLILVIFLIIVSYGLWSLAASWGNPFWFFFGMILLLLEISPYFVTTSYYFYEDEVHIKYPILKKVVRKYSHYRCFYTDKKGILLSTYPEPSRMDRFRGQSIRFSKTEEEKEEILKFLTEKIGNKF